MLYDITSRKQTMATDHNDTRPTDDNVVIEGETYTNDEIKRSKLDDIMRPKHNYEDIKSRFASHEDYDYFCRLPCDHNTRLKIIAAMTGDKWSIVKAPTDKVTTAKSV